MPMDSRRNFLGTVATGLAGTLVSVPATSAADRVRVGIIGAGDRGLELCNQLRACSNTEVTAFADIYSKRLEKARGFLPSANLFTDYRELLDDRSIDAVVIATPTHLHAQQFCDALAAGKHIYIEKTLALMVEDAKRMRAAYQKDAGSHKGPHAVQVGHQGCSSGHASDVARLLAQPDEMGQLSALAMRHFRNTPVNKPQWARPAMLTPDVNPNNVAWKQFAPDSDFDPHRFIHWRYFWDYSSGAISENMSQQLAFWYRALNLQIPASAIMNGGVFVWPDGRETPDTMDVSLVQPEGLLVSWASGFGNNQLGVGEHLLGRAGTISQDNQVRYFPQKMTRPQGAEMLGRAAQVPEAHLQNFLDAIRFGSDSNASFDLGYRVTIACIMAAESYRHKRTVHWDCEREQIV